MDFRKEIVFAKKCPYCEKKPEYVDSSIIYGKSYGMVYYCKDCDAYVGVHIGTNKALGRLANKELREAKKKAHFYFDQLWNMKIQIGITKLPKRKKGKSFALWRSKCRSQAYTWLSKALAIPKEFTHIGMFDVELCNRVEQLCKPYCKNKTYPK